MKRLRRKPYVPKDAPYRDHSPEYKAKREAQLAALDDLPEEAARLVHEYGFDRGFEAVRRFYGRWREAQQHLEAERLRLQSQRWENI